MSKNVYVLSFKSLNEVHASIGISAELKRLGVGLKYVDIWFVCLGHCSSRSTYAYNLDKVRALYKKAFGSEEIPNLFSVSVPALEDPHEAGQAVASLVQSDTDFAVIVDIVEKPDLMTSVLNSVLTKMESGDCSGFSKYVAFHHCNIEYAGAGTPSRLGYGVGERLAQIFDIGR